MYPDPSIIHGLWGILRFGDNSERLYSKLPNKEDTGSLWNGVYRTYITFLGQVFTVLQIITNSII